jgi:hypothetical protein
MLRQLLEGQQTTNRKLEAMEGEMRDVKRELQAVREENKALKRRLEEKDAEEQYKRLCAEYYFLEVRASLSKNTAGIRAKIYEVADHYNAVRYTKGPLFCTERNGRLLIVNLYFTTTSDARGFMGFMTELNHTWRNSRVKVTFPRLYTPVPLPFADMQSLYRIDYDTRDNLDSPAYTLPDVELERVLLNDKDRLQMFEKRVSMNREIRAYKCHIASVKNYKQHEKHRDNIVFASWLFHQYFDGLMTEGIIPLLIVRPEKTYEETTFRIGRRSIKRQMVQVLMDFTTEEGLNEVMPTLKEGCEMLSTKRLRTHIYANDAQQVCEFLELKHGETAALWRANSIDVPRLFNRVPHNCKHQRTL